MSISTNADILFAEILNRRATIETFARLLQMMHQEARTLIISFNQHSAEDCRYILDECKRQPPLGMLLLQAMLTHGHLIQSANLQRYLARMMKQETEAQVEQWQERTVHLNKRLMAASQQLLALKEAQKAQAEQLTRYADCREALAALEGRIGQELAALGESEQLEKVVARLRLQLEREKEALNQQYEAEKKALHQQHEASKETLHRQYDAQKEGLKRLRQQYEEQEQLLAQEVAQLRQQYEAKKKEMEQKVDKKLNKWQQVLDEVELVAKLLDSIPSDLQVSREIAPILKQIAELKRLLDERELRQKILHIYKMWKREVES